MEALPLIYLLPWVNRSIRAPLMMAVLILTLIEQTPISCSGTENFSISEFVKAAF